MNERTQNAIERLGEETVRRLCNVVLRLEKIPDPLSDTDNTILENIATALENQCSALEDFATSNGV